MREGGTPWESLCGIAGSREGVCKCVVIEGASTYYVREGGVSILVYPRLCGSLFCEIQCYVASSVHVREEGFRSFVALLYENEVPEGYVWDCGNE